MRAFFAARAALWDEWAPALCAACPELDLAREGDPASFDAVIYAPGFPEDGRAMDFTPFTRARLVQSLWAGVERIVGNPTLTQPLCRMVDPGLAQGMAEWCLSWVMRGHMGHHLYLQDGVWRNGIVPPLASERPITILGMGELGRATARMLGDVGFPVTGWSASGRPVEGVRVLAADGLAEALGSAQIVISLLPDTPETRNILDARHLAMLPKGAILLNPGRGTLIDDEALIAALDRDHLAFAVLDVFRTEPLPPAHPFWRHPKILVTPHVAAETRPASAAQVAAENLRRAMDGRPLLYQVDRARGY